MKLWIKNTDGHPDAMLTLSLLSFIFVLVKFVISGMSVTLGDASYSLGTIDAASIAAILTPVLGAYVGRRHTTAKYGQKSTEIADIRSSAAIIDETDRPEQA